MRRAGTTILLLLASPGLAGCLTDGRCRVGRPGECPADQICQAAAGEIWGTCGYECGEDADCADTHVCQDRSCRQHPSCPCYLPRVAETACNHGQGCTIQACAAGWTDADGQATNGCEYRCAATGAERCGNDLDDDCDWLVDEGCPCAAGDGRACGTDVGLCETGRQACEPGGTWSADCQGGVWPAAERCDEQDNNCDGVIDDGGACGLPCLENMVAIDDDFCLDIWEAARPDADSRSAGVNESAPVSRPGVLPWRIAAPFPDASYEAARQACERAGKRLCTAAEWEKVCRGPAGLNYVYGDAYAPLTCNGIDAHCQAQPPYKGCGRDERNFYVEPTGSFPDCVNEYGAYDVCGNLWEWVEPAPGAPLAVRGGAYNCSDSERLHRCDHIGDWGPSALGFRCCHDGVQ